jgi:hypothetical protein
VLLEGIGRLHDQRLAVGEEESPLGDQYVSVEAVDTVECTRHDYFITTLAAEGTDGLRRPPFVHAVGSVA